MKIPFTKAHGAMNDFLLTWSGDVPASNLPEIAKQICDRNTGVGADGWLLVTKAKPGADYDGEIRLINSDGSDAEMSGNGTRCAAAFLLEAGIGREEVTILTGAGKKHLRLKGRQGLECIFEMNMGSPIVHEGDLLHFLPMHNDKIQVTILNVGNPQCVVFVDAFDFDWESLGAELERHPYFPNKTNVSFVKPVDEHTIDVRFFERGAGVTMSSGTGSTGAMAAAVLRGIAKSPVTVSTPAGPLALTWASASADIFLVGPAEIVASGDFFARRFKNL